MIGNRCSSLPVSQFCPKAASLSEEIGASGRSAAISTAFHVKLAGDEERFELLRARLTPEERDQLAELRRPHDVKLGPVELKFHAAMKEVPVGIDKYGRYVPGHVENGRWVEDDGVDAPAITGGSCDFYWFVGGTVYVVDTKLSEWTTTDGPESLQVLAYGMGLAAFHQAEDMVCGQWDATGGQYWWGPRLDCMSEEFHRRWEMVKAAALNTQGNYQTGPHCGEKCYARFHCPAHAVPLAPDGAPLKLSKEDVTDETAKDLVLLMKRYKDQVKTVEDWLKDFARRRGGISDGNGKIWAPASVQGRSFLDKEGLIEEIGQETLDRYTRRGKSFDRFTWRKA